MFRGHCVFAVYMYGIDPFEALYGFGDIVIGVCVCVCVCVCIYIYIYCVDFCCMREAMSGGAYIIFRGHCV